MNPPELLSDPSWPALKLYALEHTGLSYYAEKNEDLATRISRRSTARGAGSAADYLRTLMNDPAEMDCLVGELTIGETYFFRQPEHFDLLREMIIPELLTARQHRRSIRIWSAGCATGAEPYSISLLLQLELGAALAGWDVSILATDINVDFLAQAREGRFGQWALRNMPDTIRDRCFEPAGKLWRIRPEFRRGLTFRYHNLAAGAHPSPDRLPFDLIICRNVLIYFSTDLIRTVAGRLYEYLADGGCLLVGHAEPNAQTFAMFQTELTAAGTLYRKGHGSGESFHSALMARAVVHDEPPPLPNLRSNVGAAIDLPAPPRMMPPAAVRPSVPEVLPVDVVRVLADSGHWESARAEAGKLVESDPLNAPAQFTLGLILEHEGSHEEARLALRRAIYLNRDFALAHYHLGASLHQAGDRLSARRFFSNALQLLGTVPAAEPLPFGDGITAGELKDLTRMHLELMAA